jgi:N6-L-threonylcarbamoyladenine synthase
MDLPFVPVNHIKGHIAAAYLDYTELEPPFLAFVASGGHTSIIDIRSYIDFRILGATYDDAIGEAFDKIARAMGFAYPGGAELEKQAESGDKRAVKIPLAKIEGRELDFSFSGVKTHIINYINTLNQKNGVLTDRDKRDIAASLTENVVLSSVSRLRRALGITNHKKLVCAGGVLANSHIRAALKNLCEDLDISLYIPDKKYCGDNAAMIASQAYYEYHKL